MELPELPPMPHADERGHSDSAMEAYALAYGELVREECAKAVEGEELEEPARHGDDKAYNLAIEHCAIAIRRKP